MSSWLLYIGVPMLLAIWAQMRVSSAFSRYSQVRAASGLTGAEVAREILAAARIHDVEVVETNGFLGDHYDPMGKRLCLSSETYRMPSLAAVGIAAHETGHAIQHARAYAPLQLRMMVVPVTQIASQALPFIMFGGIFLHLLPWMLAIKLGIVCYALVAFFQLITLPVEYDASRRAKVILGQMGIVRSTEEAAGINDMLGAAALTYVAAFVGALGNLLWLLSLTSRSRD